MFKKEITLFILYFIKGESHNKFSIFITFDVTTSDADSINKAVHKKINDSHIYSYEHVPANHIMIESIQMISIQLSLFGLRIF